MEAVEEQMSNVKVMENMTVDERIQERKDERKADLENQLATVERINTIGRLIVEATDAPNLREKILGMAEGEIANAYNQFKYAVDLLGVVDLGAHDKYRTLDRELGKAVNEISERM